jgi:hypothetical protein
VWKVGAASIQRLCKNAHIFREAPPVGMFGIVSAVGGATAGDTTLTPSVVAGNGTTPASNVTSAPTTAMSLAQSCIRLEIANPSSLAVADQRGRNVSGVRVRTRCASASRLGPSASCRSKTLK